MRAYRELAVGAASAANMLPGRDRSRPKPLLQVIERFRCRLGCFLAVTVSLQSTEKPHGLARCAMPFDAGLRQ